MSKRKPPGYWTLERCMEDAAQYSKRSEWSRASRSAYATASKRGWINQCCAHMTRAIKPSGYWTLKRCISDAAKYDSRMDWESSSASAYRTAQRNGWLDDCCSHMAELRNPKGHWTLQRCIDDAKRYSSRVEWRQGSIYAYHLAYRNGWVDECCTHMESGPKASANDVVYIWRDAGSDLHKVGVTSARIGEQRINICRRHNGMDPRIVLMLKVGDARAVESKLLELGTDPELGSSIDGYTEFRRLTDAQLGQAVSIAYEAALAA